ncbi:MAG: L,D-transpeptidase family protein [Deltaproteobacteria bacterium]|nr:L,D-transpeptidase family protein [Deltaproteobacteria bacterium]
MRWSLRPILGALSLWATVAHAEVVIPTSGMIAGERLHHPEHLATVYAARQFQPIWIEHGRPNGAAKRLLATLAASETEGLRPAEYHVAAVQAVLTTSEASPLRDLELLLSDGFVTYAEHLSHGRLHPAQLGINWHIPRPTPDLAHFLTIVAAAPHKLGTVLDLLQTERAAYRPLMDAVARYRTLAAEGGWPIVAYTRRDKFVPGDRDPRLATIRARLAVTGDITAHTSTAESDLFDESLQSAIAAFQTRHGLTPDGVIGFGTLAALNVTVEARIEQLLVNLERLRWLPKIPHEHYLIANIPAYDLSLMDHDKPVLTMRTIVGQPHNETPTMHDEMEYLVFNPQWNVPERIATKELLPKAKADPEYLAKRRYKILQRTDGDTTELDPQAVNWEEIDAKTIRLQQASGGDNSLGRIKFIFPNRFDVYLHDTPARGLFANQERALSHGCVRVEHPRDLAALLLRDAGGWDRAEIDRVILRGRQQVVPLPKKIPVYLLYQTAWVDDTGTVQFRNDIYGYDRRIARAMR